MITEAFDYKAWADKRTLGAIERIDRSAFPRAYEFVLQQLSHMVIVEELFKCRLTSSPPPHKSTNAETVPGFHELESRLQESGHWYREYVAALDDAALCDVLCFDFADGKSGSMSVQEILFHIINHGTYHRGSMAHALDLAMVPHPVDGYGVFVHATQPARRKRG